MGWKLRVLFVVVFAAMVIGVDTPVPQQSLPPQSYSPEQQLAVQQVLSIYEQNLRCVDSDEGLQYEVPGSTEQVVDANVIQRLILFIQRFFQGISSDEVEEAFDLLSGRDVCDLPGEKEHSAMFSHTYAREEFIQTYGENLWLSELYCDGQQVRRTFYHCPQGCSQGRCIESGEPERAITWVMFTAPEDSYSINLLNVPTGLIFIREQQEYDDLMNPNIISPADKMTPLFYHRYPIFIIDHREANLINIKIENLDRPAVKIELGESVIIANDYQLTNINGNLQVEFLGELQSIVMSDQKEAPDREYWAERRQAWGLPVIL